MFGLGKTSEKRAVEIPAILQSENPVNYDTVLDWLLGLSDKDYKVMLDVVEVYRTANKTSAKLLKIKDQPTTELMPAKPTDEETDEALDGLIATDSKDLRAAIAADKAPEPVTKPQAPGKAK